MQLGDVGGGEEANADDRGRAQQAPDALQPPHARHEPVGDPSATLTLLIIIQQLILSNFYTTLCKRCLIELLYVS